jgi:site-specific recombinase XerD
MINFKTNANLRVKQYLHRNSTLQDKKAIRAFFTVLKKDGLSKARMTALIKGSKNLSYLIDSLSQDWVVSHPYSAR